MANLISNKVTKPKIQCIYDSSLDMMQWGKSNAIPLSYENLTNASGFTSHCNAWLKKFIQGQLFEEETKNDVVCSINGDTMADILSGCSADVALLRGFAVHVNYNMNYEVDNINHIPFGELRLQAPDVHGYIGHVYRSSIWAGVANEFQGLNAITGQLTATKDNIITYAMFNPDKDVVKQQIEKAGGLANYTGQVLWVSMDGSRKYPKTRLHGIDHEVATTIKCSENTLRDALTGFMDIAVIKTSKTLEDQELQAWSSLVTEIQGVDGGGKCFVLDGLSENEMSNKIVEVIESGESVKRMQQTTSSAMRHIARAFMMPLEIVDLKDEDSGTFINRENLSGAFSKASMATAEERKILERKLRLVFSYWKYSDKLNDNNFKIKPLRFNLTEEGTSGDDTKVE